MSIGDDIEAARRAALAPEQALLRMLAQRKASRRVVEKAAKAYRSAADLMEAVLEQLPVNQTPGRVQETNNE